jgi:hypothetical protein
MRGCIYLKGLVSCSTNEAENQPFAYQFQAGGELLGFLYLMTFRSHFSFQAGDETYNRMLNIAG